ncbi:hypothetical protein TNCV_1172671 [Trichonephila clavipes]|uniref:Uncharacterized protein n=1 Tax=Trichonephila clavipes TaxID=2585209 RepID=A0A8X6VDC8_TRICX|nr:hypothetical protein TNCV_1172671 [Trichonephila clavipes]
MGSSLHKARERVSAFPVRAYFRIPPFLYYVTAAIESRHGHGREVVIGFVIMGSCSGTKKYPAQRAAGAR